MKLLSKIYYYNQRAIQFSINVIISCNMCFTFNVKMLNIKTVYKN